MASLPLKRQLSEKLKAMKFMQRKEENNRRLQLEAEEKAKLKEFQWVLPGAADESSFVGDDDVNATLSAPFVTGRRSFGNFNPLVEKFQSEIKSELLGSKAERETVTDQEMAERYTEYVGLPGKGRPFKRSKALQHLAESAGHKRERPMQSEKRGKKGQISAAATTTGHESSEDDEEPAQRKRDKQETQSSPPSASSAGSQQKRSLLGERRWDLLVPLPTTLVLYTFI